MSFFFVACNSTSDTTNNFQRPTIGSWQQSYSLSKPILELNNIMMHVEELFFVDNRQEHNEWLQLISHPRRYEDGTRRDDILVFTYREYHLKLQDYKDDTTFTSITYSTIKTLYTSTSSIPPRSFYRYTFPAIVHSNNLQKDSFYSQARMSYDHGRLFTHNLEYIVKATGQIVTPNKVIRLG